MRRQLAATAALALAGGALASVPQAGAATITDTVARDRITVRDVPGRLVLANARGGDRVALQSHCGSWVRIRVLTARTMATPVGWVERGGLTRAARAGGLAGVPDGCAQARADDGRWRSYVSAMNAPFTSYRYTGSGTPSRSETTALWRRVTYATPVVLAARPDCAPSYNYRRTSTGESVDPAQRAAGLDLTQVGYRYATRTGAVALVSVRRLGQSAGVWTFVPSSCLGVRSGQRGLFYRPVVQLDRPPKGAPPLRTNQLRGYGCHAGVRSPTHPEYGWWPDPQRKPGCPY